jgi:hypothetical protein
MQLIIYLGALGKDIWVTLLVRALPLASINIRGHAAPYRGSFAQALECGAGRESNPALFLLKLNI